jgi:hypothetical protein
MRVHRLDCATLCPYSRRLMNGDGGLLEVRSTELPLPAH